ncbi:MAG: type II CAAX prenyl endopeptidase Rce1 family protein [Nanoarchaeota archaeon]
MRKISLKVYLILIVILIFSSVISVYLPQAQMISIQQQELPASKNIIALVNALIMLILYGGLGCIGLRLSKKIDFPELWDNKYSAKEKLVYPAVLGSTAGLFLIILDYIFSFFNGFGKLIHPPFPTSFFASLSAGIGEEIIFRLFFITFWVWLISKIILNGKYKNIVFWIITVISAILFAAAHLPSIMFLVGTKTIAGLSTILIVELLILNSLISIPAAYYFRKYGILAAISIHFWADIVWHVIYGLI